jgi:integrase
VAQFQGKYRYAQTEDATKQKLYKMLTGAGESKPKNIPVSKRLDEYITHASINLKPHIVKRYREANEVHIKPALGRSQLHELDTTRIEAVYAEKLEQGVPPSTIQLIHSVLSGALKRGVRLKLVQHNPCKDVEAPRIERAEVEPFSLERGIGVAHNGF